ncbi:LegC family aminotransferase [Halobacillus litoralis]|uniref:LegC family aminotransferase n=1 Tax=Halobacillus litoralis TaxID=45668 RepID=A0A845F7G5_9BACI|nr:LegC family aminotransferase [Halobacillus litoralis]MYL69829.1 LegC family aminotransferase [Halobacillus litoralis]
MSERFIPLSVPSLRGNELKYVSQAIETEWVSSAGSYIQEFEENTMNYVGARGAVAVQNGSSGLHIALKLMDVSDGDEVIVPTLTFIAAVNPVKYCNAEPVFMDCDDSLGMDPSKLKKFFEEECENVNGALRNKVTLKPIKAIVVVHVFGNMADMESIMEIAEKYQVPVIEDATEAIGTYYTEGIFEGRYAGTIGNIGVYSFNGNKIMTTGGGGMIVSHDTNLLDRARYLTTQAKSDPLYYIHDEVGYNYRMTNLQAALGLAQLEQLENFIATKSKNYNIYKQELKEINGLELLNFRKGTRPNYWFYGIAIKESYGLHRHQLIESLGNKKIQARPIWDLIHQQKPYRDNQAYEIDQAKVYLNKIVNVPCSSNLSSEDVHYIVESLKKQ